MIVTPDELVSLNVSGQIGITSGCFDLTHFYHLHFFERCRAQCDFLIVGVDSDELVFANKNKTPVIPEFHRAAMVNAFRCVGAVFVMRNLNQLQLAINSVHAQKLFKNSPTIYGEPVIVGKDTDVKPELVIIPDVEERTSTSAIINSIRAL